MYEHVQLSCHLRRFPNDLGSAVVLVTPMAQQNNHSNVLMENKGKKRENFCLFISPNSSKGDQFFKSCIVNNLRANQNSARCLAGGIAAPSKVPLPKIALI